MNQIKSRQIMGYQTHIQVKVKFKVTKKRYAGSFVPINAPINIFLLKGVNQCVYTKCQKFFLASVRLAYLAQLDNCGSKSQARVPGPYKHLYTSRLCSFRGRNAFRLPAFYFRHSSDRRRLTCSSCGARCKFNYGHLHLHVQVNGRLHTRTKFRMLRLLIKAGVRLNALGAKDPPLS